MSGKVAANVKNSSDFNGVTYNKQDLTWSAQRWSKKENKTLNNGSYKDEESAAHASDTLAKKLIANGEKGHKLNFFDDGTEVHAQEKSCKYIGVSYNKQRKTWLAWSWSKHENRQFYNGSYKDEVMAARASDTLARKLMANGEKVHKLNFPNDDTEVMYQKKKRKDQNIWEIPKTMNPIKFQFILKVKTLQRNLRKLYELFKVKKNFRSRGNLIWKIFQSRVYNKKYENRINSTRFCQCKYFLYLFSLFTSSK